MRLVIVWSSWLKIAFLSCGLASRSQRRNTRVNDTKTKSNFSTKFKMRWLCKGVEWFRCSTRFTPDDTRFSRFQHDFTRNKRCIVVGRKLESRTKIGINASQFLLLNCVSAHGTELFASRSKQTTLGPPIRHWKIFIGHSLLGELVQLRDYAKVILMHIVLSIAYFVIAKQSLKLFGFF